MSEEPQDSTATAQPDRSALRVGLDWVAKHWPRVRLGHEGIMVDRIQRVQRIGEVLARNAMTGRMNDLHGWPGEKEGDPMGVEIGDKITNHYYPPKPSGVASTIGKAAIAAALLGTGAGGGLAVPWLAGMFSKQPPAVETPAAADTDTTRRIEVEKWIPGED